MIFTVNSSQDNSNITDSETNTASSIQSTSTPETEEKSTPEVSITSSDNRINFFKDGHEDIDVPFNVDTYDTSVHADTEIDIDWSINMPVDITVEYETDYNKSQAHDINIGLEIPKDEACLQINTTTDFNIEWDVLGVDDGEASVQDWEYDIEKFFTTPLGSYNLPSAKYGIPVSVSGVPIGTLNLKATPQIISSVKTKLMNETFLETLNLEWEEEDEKQRTLTASPNASSGTYDIDIDNFKYALSFGIEWSMDFQFTEPFNLINTLLNKLGYPLEYVLGTWPKIEVGSIPSYDTVQLSSINIDDDGVDGSSFENAIGFDVNDWQTTQERELNDKKHYIFQVQEDTTYNFTIEDATGDVNASIWDQNEDMLTSSTDSLSFNATKDTNYFLVLDPDDPCTTNVSFGGI
ncbi:MAG: hypothetical protein R6U96_17930, partial [Promethearchaeia archaeon]